MPEGDHPPEGRRSRLGSPVFFPGERWGYRHNRPQGLALTAWGAAPSSLNRDKASRRLTTNSFFLRDGSLPGWAKTLLSRLRALLRLEPGPHLRRRLRRARRKGTRPKIHESLNPGTLARGFRCV